MKKLIVILLALVLVMGLSMVGQQSSVLAKDPPPITGGDIVALGKAIFYDTNLSKSGDQSCATCHAPEVGFTGPDSIVNAGQAIYQGTLPNHFGNRKPPTAAYAGFSPELHQDATGAWFGGMFWDGRATGSTLGDALAEQAQGPFLNPLEQAIANSQVLCVKVKQAEYASLFEQVWGEGSLDCAKDSDGVYEKIGRSVAAYERSAEVNPFTSKFDKFWDNAKTAGKDVTKIQCPGMGMGCGMPDMGAGGGMMNKWPYRWTTYRNLGLSDEELIGLAVFNDPTRANCASCHSLNAGSAEYPLFTNFGYNNIGIPKNPENPFYSMPTAWNPDGENWVDYGLGGYLKSAGSEVYETELGKVKVPTLRNVDLRPSEDFVKAYGHNGYLKSLDDLILFYAWRGLTMNGGLGMGGSGIDCDMMGGGGMGGGGMGGGGMGGVDMTMMCDPNLFPQPEVNQNLTPMNHFSMMHQSNVVTFLKTLSDGYFQR